MIKLRIPKLLTSGMNAETDNNNANQNEKLDKLLLFTDELTSTLMDSSSKIESGLGGVLLQIQQTATTVSELSEGVSQTAEKIEEISAGMAEIREESSEVVINNRSNLEMINEIGFVINDSKSLIAEQKMATDKSLSATSEAVSANENITKKGQDIKIILQEVNNITRQTVLLSLNASIEAVHAGVYGKGFEVIAQEIKNLSNQTQHFLLGMVNVIEEMNAAIESVNGSILNVNKSVEFQKNTLDRLVAHFAEINSAQGKIQTNIDITLKSMENLDGNIQNAQVNIAGIASISQQTATAMEQISSAVSAENKIISSINVDSMELSNMATLMQDTLIDIKNE